MKRTRKPFGLALTFVILCAHGAQSPTITENQHNIAQTGQEHAKPEQRGTVKLPLVVEAVRAPKSEEESAYEEYERSERPINERRTAWATIFLALFTLSLAGITGALARYTYKLWKSTSEMASDAKRTSDRQARDTRDSIEQIAKAAIAMEHIAEGTRINSHAAMKSVEVIEKTAERQLRAYVSAIPDYVETFSTSIHVGMRCTVRNHGTTPAYKVTTCGDVDIFPYPLPPVFSFPPLTRAKAKSTSLAHNQFMILHITANRLFSAQEIANAVSNAGSRIYMYGIVDYIDAFGQSRVTEFCSSIVGSPNLASLSHEGISNKVDINFEICEQHNNAG